MASALIADAKERNNVRTADAFSALLQQKISLKAVKAAQKSIAQFVDDGDYADEMKSRERSDSRYSRSSLRSARSSRSRSRSRSSGRHSHRHRNEHHK